MLNINKKIQNEILFLTPVKSQKTDPSPVFFQLCDSLSWFRPLILAAQGHHNRLFPASGISCSLEGNFRCVPGHCKGEHRPFRSHDSQSPERRVAVPSLWHIHQTSADGCQPALKLWHRKGPKERGCLPASYFPIPLEGRVHFSI